MLVIAMRCLTMRFMSMTSHSTQSLSSSLANQQLAGLQRPSSNANLQAARPPLLSLHNKLAAQAFNPFQLPGVFPPHLLIKTPLSLYAAFCTAGQLDLPKHSLPSYARGLLDSHLLCIQVSFFRRLELKVQQGAMLSICTSPSGKRGTGWSPC